MPTLVFLHDSLGCIQLWRDFPERLAVATGFGLLVYDRQGYGASDPFTVEQRRIDYLEQEAIVLNQVIQRCGIQQPVLFGHSDGGSIALIAAAKYPDAIKAVITEGAHVFVEDITLQGIRAALNLYATTNLLEKLQKYHGPKADAVFHAWTDTWLSPDYASWNIEHFLPLIQCPILVIQGEYDEYGSMAQVMGIVNQTSGETHSVVIAKAGHTPHKESTQAVLTHSINFLKNLQGPR